MILTFLFAKSGSELPEGLSFSLPYFALSGHSLSGTAISANPSAHLLSIILLLFLRTNHMDRLSRHFLSESTKKIRTVFEFEGSQITEITPNSIRLYD